MEYYQIISRTVLVTRRLTCQVEELSFPQNYVTEMQVPKKYRSCNIIILVHVLCTYQGRVSISFRKKIIIAQLGIYHRIFVFFHLVHFWFFLLELLVLWFCWLCVHCCGRWRASTMTTACTSGTWWTWSEWARPGPSSSTAPASGTWRSVFFSPHPWES